MSSERIAELKRRLPSHSVSSAMLQQMEELGEELDGERKRPIEE